MKYYIVVSSAGDTKVVVLPANWDNGSLNVCLSRLKTDAQGEFRGGVKIFTKINQDEYRKVTGLSYLSSNYASHPNFFRGDVLPEDWREQAIAVLTSGGWIDLLGWEDDLAKLVDEQIDSAQMFDLMQAHMTGLDPVLELEAYDRWLYGEALAAQRKETEQSVSKEEQSVFTFLVDCQYKVWERHTVTVNADTYKEAKQRVINLAKNHPVSMDDGEPRLEMTFETLCETEELIEPENGKEATVQVMNYAPFNERKVLYENAK